MSWRNGDKWPKEYYAPNLHCKIYFQKVVLSMENTIHHSGNRYSVTYLADICLIDIYVYFQEELLKKKLSSWDFRTCGYDSVHHFFLMHLHQLYDEFVNPDNNVDKYVQFVETITNIGLDIQVADTILKYLDTLVNEVLDKAKAANKECVYIQVQEDIDYLPVASVYCLRYQNNIGVDTYVPRQENRP